MFQARTTWEAINCPYLKTSSQRLEPSPWRSISAVKGGIPDSLSYIAATTPPHVGILLWWKSSSVYETLSSAFTEDMGTEAESPRNQAWITPGQKQRFRLRYLNWHQLWLNALAGALIKEHGGLGSTLSLFNLPRHCFSTAPDHCISSSTSFSADVLVDQEPGYSPSCQENSTALRSSIQSS